MSYTTGPWKIDNDRIEHGCCWNCAIVSTIENNAYGETMPTLICETIEDNARLISAAPDLLAACEMSLECFDGFGIRENPEYFDVRSKARAAIAKARGES